MRYFDIHTHHLPSCNPEQAIVSFSIPYEKVDEHAKHISVGIHPWYLTETHADTSLQYLRSILTDERVVAIGEAGLDRLRGCPLSIQTDVFRHEIALSEEYRLPMIIHCVRAFNELIQLKKEIHPLQPWIIHGFRGKRIIAEELLRHGCYLSLGARFQEEAARNIPLERLFIETDESEEPILKTYHRIADIREISPEELTEAINKNVHEVFFKR